MANATTTPLGVMLAFQRDALRQGQRTAEQGLDAQQMLTETFVRSAVGMGRAVNRGGTEATRQGVAAYATLLDTVLPQGETSFRSSVDEQLTSYANAQGTAWNAVEEGFEDALVAYENLTERQKDVLAESVSTTIEIGERMRERSSDAALEYERQEPERIGTGREEPSGRGEQVETPDQVSEQEAEASAVEDAEGAQAPETVTTSEASETATEPEVETGQETETETGGEFEAEAETVVIDLVDIAGIGAAYAQRLRDVGIESVEQLCDADSAALSESAEISGERIENWQRQARRMLERGEEE